MEVCGDAENRLASELMQHELQLEKDVLDPLSQLAEVRNRRVGVELAYCISPHYFFNKSRLITDSRLGFQLS